MNDNVKTLLWLNTGNFATIYTQHARGVANSYEVTDAQPVPGNNYYRLKSVSNDGRVDYSHVIVVNFKNSGTAILNTYPNPFTDHANISLVTDKDQLINTIVFDFNGRLIKKQSANYSKGNVLIEIKELQKLSKEIYLIKVMYGDFNERIKMIKK